jgi:DNA-binding IclR family transcriptional regulator
MTVTPHRLLEFVVETYDEQNGPLVQSDVAAQFGLSKAEATRQFDRLHDCELVATEGDGYRPTVTARELLELDIDDEFMIVDTGSDCPGSP